MNPFSQINDAVSWAHKFVYIFPPFVLIGSIFQKVNQNQCLMLIRTRTWSVKTWLLGLLKMSLRNPLLLAALTNLLNNPAEKLNIFVMQNSLVVWTSSSKTYLQKEYQKGLPTYHKQEEDIFN